MAIKKILAAGMLALSMALAVAVVPAPAEAKTKVIIGIGGNYGGYYGGGCWNGPYYLCGYRKPHHRVFVPRHRPIYYYDDYPRRAVRGRVGCETARDILRGNGYRHIVARDCQGTSYSFKARKKGHNYIVRMNARNGRIVGVSRF